MTSSSAPDHGVSTTVHRSNPVDGFRLAYTREGSGSPVVALHGWPGDRHDWRQVAAALDDRVDLVAVDLRGFGDSDAHPVDPALAYPPAAQARSVLGLIDDLQLGPVVLAGADLGSMVAEQVARSRPPAVAGMVLSPPVPGLAGRLADPASVRERWYIAFHQSGLDAELIDGNRDAVAAYLTYFWTHCSGPEHQLDADERERLIDRYSVPGAFTAATAVYRSGRPTIDPAALSTPTTILWPDAEPLFPLAWSDDVGAAFSRVDVVPLTGVGHFTSREAPEHFAAAILRRVGEAS